MSQPLEITTHTRREVVRSIWVGVVGWYALSGFCFVGHAVRVHARGTCSFFYDLVMILFLLNDFVLARYAAVLKISTRRRFVRFSWVLFCRTGSTNSYSKDSVMLR